jgi:UDP-3-O-acyl N-acetylglucosamine deacetylase
MNKIAAGITQETKWRNCRTIARRASLSGIGLHSGARCSLGLERAEAGAGLRIWLPGLAHPFGVESQALADSSRCTALQSNGAVVLTVEHLLSALAGRGVTDCLITIEGGEVPVMDGSALPFLQAIDSAGVLDLERKQAYIELQAPVWVEHRGGTIVALPAAEFRVTYGIDFQHPLLGQQWFEGVITEEVYSREIAAARTFGFLAEVEELRRRGLALGGSLENAVVISEDAYLSPLRFPDEPVRHKVLDLVGDLALLGAPLLAHVVALKTSHQLNSMLVRRIEELRRP